MLPALSSEFWEDVSCQHVSLAMHITEGWGDENTGLPPTKYIIRVCYIFNKNWTYKWILYQIARDSKRSYLGFPDNKGRGLSGVELATLITLSVAPPAKAFSLNASSIFSTWINWPPSPLSAMNLKTRQNCNHLPLPVTRKINMVPVNMFICLF